MKKIPAKMLTALLISQQSQRIALELLHSNRMSLHFLAEKAHDYFAQVFLAVGEVGENAGADFLPDEVAGIEAHPGVSADDGKQTVNEACG